MNKPPEFTSFDVIGKLRGILHMRRLGHTGTLDPMATGVLPILVGSATKACDILPDTTKTYRASVRFGLMTQTEDIWGDTVATYPTMHVMCEELEAVIPSFRGQIEQTPPMYSAVSVDGKRLYQLARKGIEVERPTRLVTIESLEILDFDEEAQTATLQITCSKGTYIRTLIADIGRALGGGAVMASLCRTRACGFDLAQCYTFEGVAEFVEKGTIAEYLIPTDSLFTAFPVITLTAQKARLYRHGVKLELSTVQGITEIDDIYRVYDDRGNFIGTAYPDREAGVLRVGKNF